MKRTDPPFPFSLPEGDVLCAVSGGADSMCLLELSRRRPGGGRTAAAHFHHGLRGAAADRDEDLVRRRCREQGLPFYAGRGDAAAEARRRGMSVEEAGRALRYEFLERTRQREGFDYILTAHHADDDAETVLLNLIRGTGLRGLCGIPPRRGRIVRPLLHVRGEALRDLAAAWQIPFAEDETNADPACALRNRLRLEVMPLLEQIRPGAAGRMAAAAQRLREDEAALSALAQTLLEKAQIRPGVSAGIGRALLDAAPAAAAARAAAAMASAVCGGAGEVSAPQIRALLGLRRGQVSLPGGAIARAEGGRLEILRPDPPPAAAALSVGETVCFGPWQVTLTATPQAGAAALSCPAGAAAALTPWQTGDRICGRSVKRLCAEHGLAPLERDALPVLRLSGKAAAVPGLGIDEAFAPGRHAAARWVKFDKKENRREQGI